MKPTAQMPSYQQLPYRIAFCTGEDPRHRAYELLLPTCLSQGWATPENCKYPQSLVLEFMGEVELRQVQFLSHESKIASKIELYGYTPSPTEQQTAAQNERGGLGTAKFHRIGHVTLASNAASGYAVRELRSVYFEGRAAYLKLEFHECHLNPHNPQRQVGLISLLCFGDMRSYNVPPTIPPEDRLNFACRRLLKERIQFFEAAKDNAIAFEQFGLAQGISEMLKRVHSFGKQLDRLQQNRATKLRTGDYLAASHIAYEINTLSYSLVVDPLAIISVPGSTQPSGAFSYPTGPFGYPNTNSVQTPAGPSEVEEAGTTASEKTASQVEGKQSAEERKKNSPLARFASVLKPALLDQLGSPNPPARLAALTALVSHIKNKTLAKVATQDEMKAAVGVVGVLRHLISDPDTNVGQEAIHAIDYILFNYPFDPDAEETVFSNNLDPCIAALIERISDANADIREAAFNVCVHLASSQRIGLTTMFWQVSNSTPSEQEAPAQLQAKTELMTALVTTYGETNKGDIGKRVLDFTLRGLQRPEAAVKEAATALLLACYKLLKEKINSYINLKAVPAECRQILQEQLVTPQSLPHNPKQMGPPRSVPLNPEEQPLPALKAKAKAYANTTATISIKAGHQAEPDIDAAADVDDIVKASVSKNSNLQVCEYCGKRDSGFDADKLDWHMFKECPMLISCKECQSIVEIANLNNHLLTDCKAKKKYTECKQCHEAIPTSRLPIHTKKECRPLDPTSAIRCPQCHSDVKPPTIEAWKDHILSRKCPAAVSTLS